MTPQEAFKRCVTPGSPSQGPAILQPVVSAPLASGESFTLYPGVYIVYGPRAVGKTLMTHAIAAQCTKAFAAAKSASTVALNYVYEARAQRGTVDISLICGYTETSADSKVTTFTDPTRFLIDYDAVLAKASSGVFLYDSVNEPLKSFVPMRLKDTSLVPLPGRTMKGGFDSAEMVFLGLANHLAVQRSVASLFVINEDLIDYVPKLEASVEGFIRLMGGGQLELRDRSKRVLRSLRLDRDCLSLAVEALGYQGPFRQDFGISALNF